MYAQLLAGFFADNFNDRRFLAMTTFGRLKPGVALPQAEASLKTIASRLEAEYPKDNGGRSVALTSARRSRRRGEQSRAVRARRRDDARRSRPGAADRLRESREFAPRAGRAPRKRNDGARRPRRRPRPDSAPVAHRKHVALARRRRRRTAARLLGTRHPLVLSPFLHRAE